MAALSRRFNAMAVQVRELLAARTTLLAGVSHDLRTPLTRMRLALEMFKDLPDPHLLQRMEHDIDEMNRLIGDVLDLARGLGHETAVVIDLPCFLARLVNSYTSPSTISLSCPSGQCVAPPSALQRVITNLLQNALRYAPGQIELVAQPNEQGWRLGVLDRGPGIPADKLEQVFQAFFRLDASRSPVTGGSGLGLAIVRELARLNGWRVSLQPRPGGGLEAWLELPRQYN
jgi:two-component system osmolarity sensor histidine kinase EnvZ